MSNEKSPDHYPRYKLKLGEWDRLLHHIHETLTELDWITKDKEAGLMATGDYSDEQLDFDLDNIYEWLNSCKHAISRYLGP